MAPHAFITLARNIWKSRILPLLVMAGISSCDVAFGFNALDYARLNLDLETAWRKTAAYRYFPDAPNDWKSPKEFEHDGGGDCEDFATYLMYQLGDESAMYLVKLGSPKKYHAIVLYNGRYLEPQVYKRVYDPSEFEVILRLGYAATMLMATNGGSKFMKADISIDLRG
jgi:hypothetical protein